MVAFVHNRHVVPRTKDHLRSRVQTDLPCLATGLFDDYENKQCYSLQFYCFHE